MSHKNETANELLRFPLLMAADTDSGDGDHLTHDSLSTLESCSSGADVNYLQELLLECVRSDSEQECFYNVNRSEMQYGICDTMLFVFFVDEGTMLRLHMDLATKSVENLKQNISSQFRIPVEKQVLLISGGESLDPQTRVGNYSAGTDTNPIYLFSKSSLEEDERPPVPTSEVGIDEELLKKVEAALNLPPNFPTVVTRARLAQALYDQANRIIKDCENLVHEQHLQQQGWAAVVANLEDTAQSFSERAAKFEENYNSYLNTRNECVDFSVDLKTMDRIPVLPALLSASGDFSPDDQQCSLFHWISSKDNQNSLEQVAEVCVRGLQHYNLNSFDAVRVEAAQILEKANNATMKEIKGLEERLSALEHMMHESQIKVQEQKDLALGFQNNQLRAGDVGDASVLPDLCASHRGQLQLMQKTHQHLYDIRSRCLNSKDELSQNLHVRLAWITFVERSMCEVNNKLIIYYENLKRLRCHLEIVKQIHSAPEMYVTSVTEVVRRREFSKAFLEWSTSISQQALELHTNEVSQRKCFYDKISNHFLRTLFTGMDDTPPPFATEAPPPFDTKLPLVGPEDVQHLKQSLPDFAHLLHVNYLFTMPRVETPTTPTGGARTRLKGSLSASAPSMVIRMPSDEDSGLVRVDEHDEGKESETEEFEKVDNIPEGRDVAECATLVAGDDEEFSVQQGRLRVVEGVLDALYALDREKTNKLHEDVSGLRNEVIEQREEFKRYMAHVWSMLLEEMAVVSGNMERKRKEEVDSTLGQVQKQHEDVLGQFKTRLENEAEALVNANKQVDELKNKLKEADEHLRAAQEEYLKSAESLRFACEKEKQELVCAHQMELHIAEEEYKSVADLRVQENVELKEKCDELERKFNQLEEEMTQRYQLEKTELVKCLNNEKDVVVKRVEEEGRTVLEKEIERLQTEWQDKMTAKCTETELALQSRAEQVKKEIEAQYLQIISTLEKEEAEKSALLESHLEESTAREDTLKQELASERSQWEAEKQRLQDQLTELDALQHRAVSPSTTTLEDERMLATAAEDNLKVRLEAEVECLRTKHEEEVNALRSTLLAEKQVTFNEALKKVVEEKEKVIEEERSKQNDLLQQLEADRVFLQKLATENRILLDNQAELQKYKELDEANRMELERLDMELSNAQSKIERLIKGSNIHSSTSEISSGLVQSVMPLENQDRILELESTLRYKEDEMAKLQTKLMELSMTSSAATLVQQDKVSVLNCNIGDVIILSYNEKHENFLAFLVGPVYHFLHTDCLEVLGLKPVPGESRSWVLAEVTDKEYCQAKKSQNRYRVPLGTKFYRVRAKPLNLIGAVFLVKIRWLPCVILAYKLIIYNICNYESKKQMRISLDFYQVVAHCLCELFKALLGSCHFYGSFFLRKRFAFFFNVLNKIRFDKM
uniref:RB1-inducible coiled-coil protein 1 n=1 Tax=Strigamia maritima TaxID=126957 RepID=T1J8T9_STRMM